MCCSNGLGLCFFLFCFLFWFVCLFFNKKSLNMGPISSQKIIQKYGSIVFRANCSGICVVNTPQNFQKWVCISRKTYTIGYLFLPKWPSGCVLRHKLHPPIQTKCKYPPPPRAVTFEALCLKKQLIHALIPNLLPWKICTDFLMIKLNEYY